jgi:hypothetical protein
LEKNKDRGYLQTLILGKDDCAMACDNEPTCKSFQLFTDNPEGTGINYCMLMNKEPKDVTMPQNPSEFTNVEVFVKPSVLTDKEKEKIATRVYGLRSANTPPGPGYRRVDGNLKVPLDDGGLFIQNQDRCLGQYRGTFCDGQETDNIILPTGVWTAAGGQVGRGLEGGMQLHTGVKACDHIPGVVTNTIPTNKEGNNQPNASCIDGQCYGQDDSYNYCGYNSINNDWILDKWSLLSNYLENTTTKTYTSFTRPDGTKQTGILKVNSVKVAKNQYCNTAPLVSFTKPDPVNKCSEFVRSEVGNTIDNWYIYLLKRAAQEDWRPAPSVVKDGCTTVNSSVTPYCVSALRNLNVDDTMDQSVLQSLNEINGKENQSTETILTIKDKVETYCQKHQNSKACECRNADKYGITNCKPDIPGCEDMIIYQKLLEAVDENSVLNEYVKNFQPRALAGACQIADSVNENTVLQYGKAPKTNVNLNTCILNLKNQGQLTAENIVQKCEFTLKKDEDADRADGADGADGTSGSSTWIWILLAIVGLIVISGVAGIALFALS